MCMNHILYVAQLNYLFSASYSFNHIAYCLIFFIPDHYVSHSIRGRKPIPYLFASWFSCWLGLAWRTYQQSSRKDVNCISNYLRVSFLENGKISDFNTRQNGIASGLWRSWFLRHAYFSYWPAANMHCGTSLKCLYIIYLFLFYYHCGKTRLHVNLCILLAFVEY